LVFAFATIGLLATMAVGTGSAQAGTIAPTGLNASASTPNLGLGGAVPKVLVQAGGQFTLSITLSPDGAAFNKDTPLTLTPSIDPNVGGQPQGTFSPSTVTFPGGVSSASFLVSYSAVDNGVILTASAPKNTKAASGSTQPFDVLKTVLPLAQGNPQFPSGVGVGDNNCGDGTDEPECGIVVLPNDIQSANGALTLGKCTPTLNCASGSQIVQFVADLGTRYSPTSPAELIFRCSKQQCRNSNNGIRNFTIKVSQSATGPLDHVSQPCIAKGVADNGLNNGDTFCTDYNQSHRDNSGALILVLLFTEDMRGSGG
jgi:hypothetical protein